jgi:SAM-dependent methyltransferase/predicted metal-dependent enzyme (double-stranded beta helix superfamily)
VYPLTTVSLSDLPKSLQQIALHLRKSTKILPVELRKTVLAAGVVQEDLLPWAAFNHPVADSYGRQLVYKEANFEIMVMSWLPGDFSGLHDHGFTQYGTVQVFGTAEHAVFHVEEDTIRTLARWTLKPGEAISVSHSLVHQMGNAGAERFLSLHVYGTPLAQENITGEARVFDLYRQRIQRVDGGVFFGLRPEDVVREEVGPEPDFPTLLRYLIELYRRQQKMSAVGIPGAAVSLQQTALALSSAEHQQRLLGCLQEKSNTLGHATDSVYWKILNQELRELAKLQKENHQPVSDAFHRYAELYDAVICQPCLDDFMAAYLRFFFSNFQIATQDLTRVLSVGCGTGLVEAYMISHLGLSYDALLGIDISPAMVAEAKRRIRAEQGDIFTYQDGAGSWQLIFSGLNVLHYLPHLRFDEAVDQLAYLLAPGGWFVGDFITPDHIRWYPNIMISADQEVISLRTPQLAEEDGFLFQDSDIINISFQHGSMELTDAGRHRRYLPPLHRVRSSFERAFGGPVFLYDAFSLNVIPESADSCASTRYVVLAQKAL